MASVNEGMISRLRGTEDRFWGKVDKTPECWNWNAGKTIDGYGVFHSVEGSVGAHRVAYSLSTGPIPDGMSIDHVCHNPSCVRPAHLRLATPKQNAENLNGLTAVNTSGYRGVSYDRSVRRAKPWVARIRHHGRQIHCGMFATAKEAHEAVLAKRNELFTHNDLDRKTA